MFSKVLNEIIYELHNDFSLNPYDYTSYEMEAQVKVFNKIKNLIEGKILINNDEPIPPFVILESCRVRIEYRIDKNRHDIVIFKNNSNCKSYNDVEAFIEIKVGWGFTKDHLLHPTIKKDLELISKFPEKGFLIIFLSNNFYNLDIRQQRFYTKKLEEHKKNYKINNNHIYLIFRDKFFI